MIDLEQQLQAQVQPRNEEEQLGGLKVLGDAVKGEEQGDGEYSQSETTV